ncbi:uncharacterized protein LOC121182696 [Toxotes jaculatrix]|uniref:uncharacterized protein LOC121182696 n=1 Tax=Toxotes jaculatrix TaxID=941984 RepID=UPI001B3AA7F6|nr:uncharacterized protein LOC121182696 [Toxotes jaculatrix]
MGGRNCCIKNCRRRSHDYRGRKIPNGLTFHCFPAWRRNEGTQTSELTRRRRAAWVAAVGRSHITFKHIPSSMRVCSRHFHSGKPAYEMLESDPDWVPSLHLGHSEGKGRRAERLPTSVRSKTDEKHRRTTETRPPEAVRGTQRESEAAGGPGRPAVLPWSQVKSLLLSVLQSETSIEMHVPPAAVRRTDLSFRDSFRDALQASLEATSRSRAQSQRPSSVSGEYEVELDFKVPHLKDQNQTCEESSSSPSSCLNCVRLQRRIKELEEKLCCLTGQQEDTQTTPVSNSAPVLPDQVLQSLEPVPTVEEQTKWMEPLSPPQASLHDSDQEADLVGDSLPSTPMVSQNDSSKRKPRPPPRFNKGWLSMFWFLRYSPALDQMWCHVCRLHADSKHQNLSLIRGSRTFKIHSIKKHRDSLCHKDSLEQYILHT